MALSAEHPRRTSFLLSHGPRYPRSVCHTIVPRRSSVGGGFCYRNRGGHFRISMFKPGLPALAECHCGADLTFIPSDITPRMFQSPGIPPILDISDGMGAPIGMASFPAVKALQAEWFAYQPNVAWS